MKLVMTMIMSMKKSKDAKMKTDILKPTVLKSIKGLAILALFAFVHSANAEEKGAENTEQANTLQQAQTLEEVYVYGEAPDLALPVKKLDQTELEKASSGNMTKLLESMPGVSNASFGEGVGSPVIRGMSANRVKLSVNGASNADVSNMSADHAPMMDIVNADEVEVIYGPNTLRFGSGAMGGLVNVKDGRFHSEVFDGITGRVQGGFGSNASAKDGAATFDFANANGDLSRAHIGHLDIFYRQSDNYKAGEYKGESQEINSTSTEAAGGSAAYNWVDNERGSIGIAMGYSDYEYGIPNNTGDEVMVTPEQWRVDVQGNLLNLTPTLENWETKLSYIDYEHEELLEENPEAIFDKEVTELQSTLFFAFQDDWQLTTGIHLQFEELAVCHDHGGCSEIPDYSSLPWDGNKGANLINDTFAGYSFSHSTPMPLIETLDAGIYAIVAKNYDLLTAEFGLRYDSRTISADPTSILPSYRRAKSDYDDKRFKPISASVGLSWQLTDQRLALNLSHSERAPSADEMYYNGDHHATFSYQLDNIDLDVETANSVDLTWQINFDKVLVETALFYYDFADYIYNDKKAIQDPYHGRDVYRYEQEDAWFTGGEATLEYLFADSWQAFVSMDVVKAQLKKGENKNLPRTPPASLRTGLMWQRGPWDVEANVHYFAKQNDVAENESVNDAYTTLNAYAAYRVDSTASVLTLQLNANNLLNEYGLNHVSYLKEISPVQGRNIEASFVWQF
jgi:iron complex outermembrane receptor protein